MQFIRSVRILGATFIFFGVAIVLLAVQYIHLSPWDTVVTTIGSVMIGVGTVEWIFHVCASEQFVERLSSAVLKAIKLPIREFYESRGQLEPVERELENIEELWAAWHTGPYASLEAFFPTGRQGRILLTKPSSSVVEPLAKVGERDADSMTGVIKGITQRALQKGLDVRWLDGLVCNSLIIANPKKDSAWARLEVLIPDQPPKKRPSFRVEKASSKDLFETFYYAFEGMWNASEPPDLGLS